MQLRLWKKKAVIFLNANSDDALDQPLVSASASAESVIIPGSCYAIQVKLAHALGGDIRLGSQGEYVNLSMAEERAKGYVDADPSTRFLSPFGLRKNKGDPIFELFRTILLEALCFVPEPPKRSDNIVLHVKQCKFSIF